MSLTNRCFLCHECEETADHLLLHCAKTRVLWELLFSLVGVAWVNPSSVWDTLLSWNGSFIAKDQRRIWKVGPLCIFWVVWKGLGMVLFLEMRFCPYKMLIIFFCTSP